MSKIGLFVAAMSAAGFMASAVAADSPWSATLQTPLASSVEVTAGGGIFMCKAGGCVIENDDSDLDAPEACRGLAREVGVLTAFGKFDAAALAKCNRVAKH